jgi:hypothetical protein
MSFADLKISSLIAENRRLRDAGRKLEAALDAVDCAVMSPAQVDEDTRAVGGPVSAYCITYDEAGVVKRVKECVEQLRTRVHELEQQCEHHH